MRFTNFNIPSTARAGDRRNSIEVHIGHTGFACKRRDTFPGKLLGRHLIAIEFLPTKTVHETKDFSRAWTWRASSVTFATLKCRHVATRMRSISAALNDTDKRISTHFVTFEVAVSLVHLAETNENAVSATCGLGCAIQQLSLTPAWTCRLIPKPYQGSWVTATCLQEWRGLARRMRRTHRVFTWDGLLRLRVLHRRC